MKQGMEEKTGQVVVAVGLVFSGGQEEFVLASYPEQSNK